MSGSKKSVFFTIDALLASGIIILSIVLISKFYYSEQQTANVNYASRDLINVFSALTVSQINNAYVQNLTASGIITNTNNTLIEQIGEFWSEESPELAANFTRNITEGVIPSNYGFSVLVNDEVIYSRSLPLTRSLVSSKKIISGIAKAKPTEGYTSRAYLSRISSKTNTKYYASDIIAPCYKSAGDSSNADKASIEYTIDLPADANVTNATWILVPAIASTKVGAYINNNLVFSGIPSSSGITNAQGNFTGGANKIRYNQTVTSSGGCPGDDGTSHLILTYKTKQLQTLDNKTNFPLAVVYADGRISDYEKPIFAPNTAIGKMNISLNLNASSVNLSFRLNARKVSFGNKSVINKKVEWTDTEIRNNLTANNISYNALSDTFFYFIFDFKPKNNNVTIFENSSVSLEGSQQSVPFGSIDVTQPVNLTSQSNSAPFGWCPNSYYDVTYGFNVPNNSVHLYSDWLIGWCWSADADQIAKANGINLYRHVEGDSSSDSFIEAFARFGYTKNTASGSVVTGANSFSLQFGSDYSTVPGISYGENVFVIPNSVDYTSVVGKSEGCSWKVQTDQMSQSNIKIPSGYGGVNSCTYNQTAITYNSNDSNQVAALEIFKLLDLDDDRDVDVLISDGDVEIYTIVQSKVPSLWGPAIVEIRVWE